MIEQALHEDSTLITTIGLVVAQVLGWI